MKRIVLGLAATAFAVALAVPAHADTETCVTWGPPRPDFPNQACVPAQVCLPCILDH